MHSLEGSMAYYRSYAEVLPRWHIIYHSVDLSLKSHIGIKSKRTKEHGSCRWMAENFVLCSCIFGSRRRRTLRCPRGSSRSWSV